MFEFLNANFGNILVGIIVLAIIAAAIYVTFIKKSADDTCEITRGSGCGSCTRCK